MAKAGPGKGSGTGKSGGASRPTKTTPGSKQPAKAAPGSKSSRARKPPPVVTQQPKPWGWIALALVVALFAVAAIGYAVVQVNRTEALSDPDSIDGLQTKTFESSTHVEGEVDYGEDSPPFGGEHDIVWADCTGTVYDIPVRAENAVHGLEHGAVWITYNPDLPQDEIDQLAELVDGEGYLMLSPYPELSSPISLQGWGNQVFVDSADDPRVEQFIRIFKQSPTNTPEPGATCDRPEFAADPIPEETGTGSDPGGTPPSDAGVTTDPAATP